MSERLTRHLREWLGRWPAQTTVDVVGALRREQPGWDGRIFPVVGIRTPDVGVLSVPPAAAPTVRELARGGDWADVVAHLPSLLGRSEQSVYSAVFRWCEHPAPLPDAGTWIDANDPVVPPWLWPFGHEVLVAVDPATGGYLAGVGIKRHDQWGQELAVGTEPGARGRGLARRLVAQAARRVLDEGRIATYQHEPTNLASAKVADAAGFPDLGWRSIGLG